MAGYNDRNNVPDLLQTGIAISLGACFKGLEMMKTPQQSATKMFGEMIELVTVPLDADGGLQGKAEAAAGVWMEKAALLMESCRDAGEKFTESK